MPIRLGTLEELVLLAVWGLGDEAYAVPIQQRIEQRAAHVTSLGSIYRTLSRLEKKGLVTSWMGAVSNRRGGKRKRFYRVTGTGKTALYRQRLARERMWQGLEYEPSLRAG